MHHRYEYLRMAFIQECADRNSNDYRVYSTLIKGDHADGYAFRVRRQRQHGDCAHAAVTATTAAHGQDEDDEDARYEVVYRIRLPGHPIKDQIGEGKPENQNQAMPFTRGTALQTEDMNQVGQ